MDSILSEKKVRQSLEAASRMCQIHCQSGHEDFAPNSWSSLVVSIKFSDFGLALLLPYWYKQYVVCPKDGVANAIDAAIPLFDTSDTFRITAETVQYPCLAGQKFPFPLEPHDFLC